MTRPVIFAELYDDELSDAYHVGQIDARNRRPRRIDLADTTPLAAAYHHGYDSRAAEWCECGQSWDRPHKRPCPYREDDR